MGGYIGARAGTLTTTVANVQDVTATDTTPEVTIINNTHEDTDGGREGKVIFKGQQSGGEESTLAEIQASHDGSDGASPTEAMRIDSSQNVGIGESNPSLGGSANGLHITGASGNDGVLKLDSSDSTHSGKIQFTENGTDQWRIAYDPTNNHLEFTESGVADRMVIEDGGNVGIGTNTPSAKLQVVDNSALEARVVHEGNGTTVIRRDGTESLILSESGNSAYRHLVFGQQASAGGTITEVMRIDSTSGKFLIGTTTVEGAGHTFSSTQYNLVAGTTSTLQVVQFRNPNGKIGTIVLSGSSTAYNTSSDYRLKENVETLSGAITRVKALKPKRFSWIADEQDSANVDGFLAHEAATVVPEAVTGTKDEVEVWQDDDDLPDGVSVGDNKLDADGNTIPEYQGIDQAKLVPLLTAALQEAIAKIETLETKVAALEAE